MSDKKKEQKANEIRKGCQYQRSANGAEQLPARFVRRHSFVGQLAVLAEDMQQIGEGQYGHNSGNGSREQRNLKASDKHEAEYGTAIEHHKTQHGQQRAPRTGKQEITGKQQHYRQHTDAQHVGGSGIGHGFFGYLGTHQ